MDPPNNLTHFSSLFISDYNHVQDDKGYSKAQLNFSRKFRNPGESAFRIISSDATAPTWCWSHPRPALTTPPEGSLGSRWSTASDQTVPSFKFDCSQPLRAMRILTTCLGSQFNACSYEYRSNPSIAPEESAMSKKRRVPRARKHLRRYKL